MGIPGGTLQLGETLRECAAREVLEETGVTIAVGECVYVFDLIERDESEENQISFCRCGFCRSVCVRRAKGADDAGLQAGFLLWICRICLYRKIRSKPCTRWVSWIKLRFNKEDGMKGCLFGRV